jgi:hypothetical protein
VLQNRIGGGKPKMRWSSSLYFFHYCYYYYY